MKRLFSLLLILLLVGCSSHKELEPIENSDKWLNERYSLGMIYTELPNKGLVVTLISKYSNTYSSGLKSGWILVSMEGNSLGLNGSALLNQRLQDAGMPDEIEFKVDTGQRIIQLVLKRQKFGTIKKEQDSYVVIS